MVSVEAILARQIKKTLKYVLSQFELTGNIVITYKQGIINNKSIISAKVTDLENLYYYRSVKRFADEKILDLSKNLANKYLITLDSYESSIDIDSGMIRYNFIFTQLSPLMDLPTEILHVIMNDFSYDEIVEICSTSTDLNISVCLDQSFWRHKYISMSGFNPPPDIDMRQAVNNYGRALSFGHNVNGQLGIGSFEERIIEPTPVKLEKPIKDVSLAGNSCIFTDVDNNIWGTGVDNIHIDIKYEFPVLYEQLYLVEEIDSYVDSDGNYAKAELKSNSFHSTLIFDSININDNNYILQNMNSTIIALDNDNKLIGMTSNKVILPILYNDSIMVGSFFSKTDINLNIEKIYVGYSCIFMITNNDTLYTVGFNFANKLGIGSIHTDNIHR